jgi:hypothetical protein
MTLHEAIIKLMQQTGKSMTTGEIAAALNQNGWYSKKDNSEISAFQIHGRTKNYPQYFDRQGSTVILKGSLSVAMNMDKTKSLAAINPTEKIPPELSLKMLMNEKNFKSAGSIDQNVPDVPGLYCIRVISSNAMPEPFNSYLTERKHNIIYIGIATTSLNKRFLGQELRARGHGTFFRGIGAVLGFRPIPGSLKNYSNKNNYTFSTKDETSIIQWINKNLMVNWVSFDSDFEQTETQLIEHYLPLLNSDKNPAKLDELAALRKECREIANK